MILLRMVLIGRFDGHLEFKGGGWVKRILNPEEISEPIPRRSVFSMRVGRCVSTPTSGSPDDSSCCGDSSPNENSCDCHAA